MSCVSAASGRRSGQFDRKRDLGFAESHTRFRAREAEFLKPESRPWRENQKSIAKVEFYPAVSVKENVTQIQDEPYFLTTFWLDGGCPKYYNNSLYPIDIHCSAQGIVTCIKLKKYDERSISLAEKIAKWAIENMQDEKGYFYYQKTCRG